MPFLRGIAAIFDIILPRRDEEHHTTSCHGHRHSLMLSPPDAAMASDIRDFDGDILRFARAAYWRNDDMLFLFRGSRSRYTISIRRHDARRSNLISRHAL